MNNLKSNKFGTGIVKTAGELTGSVYITSASCISVFAETLGWANANVGRIVDSPEKAENIIVLSCQVTDLAILNDFKTTQKLMSGNEGKRYFIGGCLAQRFDIDLPEGVERLEHLRADYQKLTSLDLINYEKPFWVPDFSEDGDEFEDGHLFRSMYPLRIGAGCHGNCKYCTIKITRGQAYDLVPGKLTEEFMSQDDILIVADSVCPEQIKEYSQMAVKYGKTISFRNVEPQNVVAAEKSLNLLADHNLLRILHTPVQAFKKESLQVMNRNSTKTHQAMDVVRELRRKGVYTATNIIIDYDACENNFKEVYDLFDYVTWNPYWNGIWDATKAQERWDYYFDKFSLDYGKIGSLT